MTGIECRCLGYEKESVEIPDRDPSRRLVRLATWNLCCLPARQDVRLEVVKEKLLAANPDVVALQEAWNGAADEIAEALSMQVVAHGKVPRAAPSQVALLSRHHAHESGDATLPGRGDSGHLSGHAYCVLDLGTDSPWAFHTAHLAWGSRSESVRTRQAQAIEEHARGLQEVYPELVQVATGDFNALPDSHTIRFLTGLEPSQGESCLWVDAWAKSGHGPGWTSDPALSLASDTAEVVGILDPSLLPSRRIDYVMTRGYAHGRAGCPLGAWLLDGEGASDHHGIVADLWLP